MSTFVYDGRGYIKVDDIERARAVGNGKWRVETKGGTHEIFNFDSELVSVVPCAEPLECLIPASDEDDVDYYSVPVIAWGMTVLGVLVPVTAFEPDGVGGNYAIRKPGDRQVASCEALYDDADQWVAEMKKYAALTSANTC